MMLGFTPTAQAESESWQPPTEERLQQNLAQVAPSAPENLVANGSFEEPVKGSPVDGWSRSFWSSEQSREIAERAFQRTDEAAYVGDYALELDTSHADLSGRVFLLRQIVPIEPIRGRPVRYTVHTLLRTQPNPDGDPVQLTLRQYSAADSETGRRDLLEVTDDRFAHEDAAGWMRSHIDADIREDTDKVDVKVQFPSALPEGKPAVFLVDGVDVRVRRDPALSATLSSSSIAIADGGAVHVAIGRQIPREEALPITLALRRDERTVWKRTHRAERRSVHMTLPTAEIEPGRYQLTVLLEVPGVGPVALERKPITIYTGPFAKETD